MLIFWHELPFKVEVLISLWELDVRGDSWVNTPLIKLVLYPWEHPLLEKGLIPDEVPDIKPYSCALLQSIRECLEVKPMHVSICVGVRLKIQIILQRNFLKSVRVIVLRFDHPCERQIFFDSHFYSFQKISILKPWIEFKVLLLLIGRSWNSWDLNFRNYKVNPMIIDLLELFILPLNFF